MYITPIFGKGTGKRCNHIAAPPKQFLFKHWWNKKLACCGTASPPIRSCYGIPKQSAPPPGRA